MNKPEKTTSHAHAPGPSSDVPEPILAERARTLVYQGGQSTLATVSRKHPGYPFGSLMPYGLTEDGEPTILISSMAMHTQNVLADPRSTLLVVQATDEENSLGAGRISLMGEVHLIEDEAERDIVAQAYLARNPHAQNWVHFGDFRFFQLRIVDIYLVAGFGVMGWITTDEYKSARPDPLADFAVGILQHMNEDHRDSLKLFASHYRNLAALDAEMVSVDRLGFNVRVSTDDGMKGMRLAYPQPAETADEVRRALVAMVKSIRNTES